MLDSDSGLHAVESGHWSRDQSVKVLVLVSSFLKRSWQQHC